MALVDEILNVAYYIIMIPVFIVGFNLARRGLVKINKIQEQSFRTVDWIAAIVFGAMFTIVIVFCINLVIDFVTPALPSETLFIQPVGKYLLWMALGILLVYPFAEMLYLARPTTGVDTGFHRFIEAHVVNKLHGNAAYIASAVILVLIYVIPIILVALATRVTLVQAGFLWIVIVPLIYLNYFAAAGTASNLIKTSYTVFVPGKKYPGIDKFQNPVSKLMNLIKFGIAVVPLIIAIVGLYTSFTGVFQGTKQKTETSAYLSLITTVAFGVLGFFTRFWKKKSKTRIIDFVFAGYIMIAIMMNILINFMSINATQVLDLFNVTNPLFGGILTQVEQLLQQSIYTLPIITLQNFITVGYTLVMLFRKNSEFQANLRLNAVVNAYEKSSEKQLARLKKLDALLQKASGKNIKKEPASKAPKQKEPNYLTILKSIVLAPGYDKYGVDVNEQVREKARQYIAMIAQENPAKPELIKNIIAYLQAHAFQKGWSQKHAFLSPQAFAALGEIGKLDSGMVIETLAIGLTGADEMKRRYILNALGLLGAEKGALKQILSKQEVKKALNDASFDVKNAAVQSIMDLGMAAKDVLPVLDALQLLIDESISTEQVRSEYLIEALLLPLFKLSARQPMAIDFDKILSFLSYQPTFAEQDTIDYILLLTIRIIAYLALYNPDKVPVDQLVGFANDKRDFIRCVAINALGNFILKSDAPGMQDIISLLVKKSLEDKELEVREMCNQAIAEYIISAGNDSEVVNIDGNPCNLLECYIVRLGDERTFIAENASDALKTLARQYSLDIHKVIEQKLANNDESIIRNCVYVLGTLNDLVKKNVDLTLLYERLGDTSNDTRCEILKTLGHLGLSRPDVDATKVASYLTYEQDADVRFNAAFALGKIGTLQPVLATHFLIEHLHKLDLTKRNLETELIFEALGIIGHAHPLDDIIEELEIGLIGDTNPFIKDCIAKALYNVGDGLIDAEIRKKKGLQDNKESSSRKMTYHPGNVIMILLNALQLKGIPDSVVEIISDEIQDLLPYFLVIDDSKLNFDHLDTLKQFLVQSYNSNVSHGIIEAIDRINSLKAFRMYMHDAKDADIEVSSRFFTKQFTPDGERFYNQGIMFKDLELEDYAIESFKIALELSPSGYFAPACHHELGMLILQTDKARALDEIEQAGNVFAFFHDITGFKACKQMIEEIQAKQ
ncbi:MAG TPA: hypothetical protein VKM55_23920 [Candidatus Lokiarchaeia archaeon]|nr:hypothetical protein [Candidatus Lokiarchaeia archaeon]